MAYQWLTLAAAQQQLAARLADPANAQWSAAELSLYLQDALRQWNSMTATWKTDFSFLNAGPSVWSRLDKITNSPRLRTVTDVDVYTLMEYMLLEPPTGGTWTGTSQFSLADLQYALQNRRDEIIQYANCNQAIIYVPGTPNVRRYLVPDTTLEIQRIRWPLVETIPTNPVAAIALTPSAAGSFSVPHNLSTIPQFVVIEMATGGQIWLDTAKFDATNLYLVASDAGIDGTAYVWTQPADAVVNITTAVGNFTVAHGLGVVPVMGFIELDSGVALWFQSTPYDATNLYLGSDAAGMTARVVLWKATPSYITAEQEIALSPPTPGTFTVPHTLNQVPTVVITQATSPGAFWTQQPTSADTHNVYLVASDGGITGNVFVWLSPSPTISGEGITLVRDDTMAQEFFADEYYQQAAGVPEAWMVSAEPPLSFNIEPPPADVGIMELLVSQSGLQFNPPNPTLLGIPDDFAWLARWGALADLLGRESEATDRARAAWCQKRYEEGLKLLVNTPWILLGRVNNVATDVPTFVDMDRYEPEWDDAPDAIDVVVSAGIDMLASAIGSSAFVTVLQNAPFLDTTGTYVQISRDQWDAVLSYAQFLATFKMGGAEFQQALELEKIFLAAAHAENTRLRKLGLYSDALLERAGAENREMERY